jgi:SAM-dependent methyltransferase
MLAPHKIPDGAGLMKPMLSFSRCYWRAVFQSVHDSARHEEVTVLSEPDDPLLQDSSVDRIFICDTWHHIDNHAHYLTLLKKALRPGGQIIEVDFKKAEIPVGPPSEMKIAREALIHEMEANGFRLAKEHTFLPYQYFLIFGAR